MLFLYLKKKKVYNLHAFYSACCDFFECRACEFTRLFNPDSQYVFNTWINVCLSITNWGHRVCFWTDWNLALKRNFQPHLTLQTAEIWLNLRNAWDWFMSAFTDTPMPTSNLFSRQADITWSPSSWVMIIRTEDTQVIKACIHGWWKQETTYRGTLGRLTLHSV